MPCNPRTLPLNIALKERNKTLMIFIMFPKNGVFVWGGEPRRAVLSSVLRSCANRSQPTHTPRLDIESDPIERDLNQHEQ
jgi:hypothetical protein